MTRRFEDARILMYSHDTFGLGHLRRCRTIAHSLVEDFRGLNILIVSGAQIAGAFDYRARVDFVKIPSVIKLRNGEYTSLERHIALQDTLKMRQSIIRHAFRFFLGRNEMPSDSQTLLDADRAYVSSGGSFRAVVVSLLTSDSFIYRKPIKDSP